MGSSKSKDLKSKIRDKAMDAAKMVMGPRPGLAIVKFWQGVVEIVLRILVIVGSIATLIASAIAYDHVKDLPNRNNVALNNLVQSVADINYRSFVFNSIAGGATGIGISILVLIYEMLPIILRFLNIGLINYKIKIFLGIDIVISFVLAAVFGIVGILTAYMAVQWDKLVDNNDSRILREIGTDAVPKARNVMAATAGTSLLTAIFMSFLMTWLIFFLIQKWNSKVVKETVKGAVF